MRRTRFALLSGCVLLVLACLTGGCLPAILEPQPPWQDPYAQQAGWGRQLTWLLTTAFVLLIGAWTLLAYGWVRWRRHKLERTDRRTSH